MFTSKCQFFYSQHSRRYFRIQQNLLEISNILYLAWLGNSITLTISISFKTFLSIKIHYKCRIFKHAAIEQKTTNNSSCPSFPMIAMDYNYFLRIMLKIMNHFFASKEQKLEKRSLVVFPFNINDIH